MDRISIEVSPAAQDDLACRPGTTVLPTQAPEIEWSREISTRFIRHLVDQWNHEYHWQAEVDRLNRYEPFRVDIDGCAHHVA